MDLISDRRHFWNQRTIYVKHQKRHWQPSTQPEQAAILEEIGPENDPANFLSAHLTNHYSVNMAEAQQTGQHSPPGDEKVRISHM